MTPTIAGPDGTDETDEPGGETCFGCKNKFAEGQHTYREVFGEIGEVVDGGLVFGTTGGVVVRHWCRDCWNRERGREKAAHYNVTDGDELWDILSASDGSLVADLMPTLVGGRAWIRVVDGELQARNLVREATDTGGIRYVTERSEDFGLSEFGEYFDDPGERTRVYLKPVGETPFADSETS